MTAPNIRITRCPQCAGTGNRHTQFLAGKRLGGPDEERRVMLTCRTCSGRGYTKESK